MTSVAFFDLDYTLLNTSSGIIYLKEALWQRHVSLRVISRLLLKLQLKQIDYGQANAQLILHVGKTGQNATREFFQEWINRRLLSAISERGREKITWHLSQGHRVVIISASIEEIVRPVAHHMGLNDNYLCSRLEVNHGHYTGRLDGPVCYGPAKVFWAKQWAAKNNLNFPACVTYFYSDSSSDMPLLELAQNPVAVNPSPKLAAIAARRGWPVERFY